MQNTIFVKIQTIPLLQKIEHCHGVSKSHLKIFPNSLSQVFQAADLRQQREDRFNQHPVVPLTAPTNFQVVRRIGAAAKSFVRQDDHFLLHGFDQREKFLIGNICRLNLPIGNESELVGQQAEFAADNPLPSHKTFLADAVANAADEFHESDDTVQCRKNQSRRRWSVRQEIASSVFDVFSTAEKVWCVRAKRETMLSSFASSNDKKRVANCL